MLSAQGLEIRNLKLEIPRRMRGFTLIELLVVLAIIGILIGLAIAAFAGSRSSARDARRKSDLEAIRSAVELYRADNRNYPCFGTSGCGWASPTGLEGLDTYINPIPSDPLWLNNCPDSKPSYLYTVNGNARTQYTVLAKLERGTPEVKPAPLQPCVSADSNRTCTINGGTCNGVIYNYWVNSP